MIKKVEIIILLILILGTGCSHKKCVKSHEEKDRCFYYIYNQIGDVRMMTPIYYNCIRTVCDEYED